jgi:hypothetical protein
VEFGEGDWMLGHGICALGRGMIFIVSQRVLGRVLGGVFFAYKE